jgi:TPR repeat protein
MMANVDKSWRWKSVSRDRKFDLEATRAKADRGDAEAQFALGLKYGWADGEAGDVEQSAQWYRKAADQNHSLAQFNLGLMYAKGEGVPQDDAEAMVWIRKAAHLGDAGAQFNLGTRYHRASVWGRQLDALESRVEAYKWLQLAATQGYKGSAEACERVTLGMSREEVAEGNRRTVEFVPHQPPEPQAG